jgi:hypothetical protein
LLVVVVVVGQLQVVLELLAVVAVEGIELHLEHLVVARLLSLR